MLNLPLIASSCCDKAHHSLRMLLDVYQVFPTNIHRDLYTEAHPQQVEF